MVSTEFESELEQALAAARGGDRAAFARIVALTQGMVTAIALAICGDAAASEDVAQDTYLEAWRRLPQLHAEASLLPWLREVTRNKAIDVLRRRRPQVATDDALVAPQLVASDAEPPDALDAAQRNALLARALGALSDDAREVVLLYYRAGERAQHVAALLGLSEVAVRKRLQRARETLRGAVEREVRGYAVATSPGAGFGAAVSAAIGGVAQAGGTAGGVGGFWKALAGLGAAVGVVVGAVFADTWLQLRRVADPQRRRALIVHGIVYAALMGGYIAALGWVHETHREWVFPIAALTVAGIFALTWWRARILRR